MIERVTGEKLLTDQTIQRQNEKAPPDVETNPAELWL
jgi:hypothetical protein